MVTWLTAPEFLWAWIALAGLVFLLLFWVKAPYGRHSRGGWGPSIPARAGWILMELPALLVPLGCLVLSGRWDDLVAVVFLTIWSAHYFYRSLIYPFLSQVPGRPTPLSIIGMGAGFNVVNGAVQGAFLFLSTPPHSADWLSDGRFWLGLAVFVLGFFFHVRADAILRGLRSSEGTGYRIPQGFLYRFVSCPNYLGEMTEWIGWAILTWSLAGTSFAVWTIANLFPRAVAHHRWYQREFQDYPTDRKAVIPFVL